MSVRPNNLARINLAHEPVILRVDRAIFFQFTAVGIPPRDLNWHVEKNEGNQGATLIFINAEFEIDKASVQKRVRKIEPTNRIDVPTGDCALPARRQGVAQKRDGIRT